MSEWIIYQGKPLGRIKLDDNDTNKIVFVAENLEALAALFQINPTDEVEIGNIGRMRYEKFQQEYLRKISGFYPTFDEWILRNERGRTVAQHQVQELR